MEAQHPNVAAFVAAYLPRLIAAMKKDPAGWMDTPATAPALAEKMVAHLAMRRAQLSPVVKSTARALGIKPTIGGIAAFLRGGV